MGRRTKRAAARFVAEFAGALGIIAALGGVWRYCALTTQAHALSFGSDIEASAFAIAGAGQPDLNTTAVTAVTLALLAAFNLWLFRNLRVARRASGSARHGKRG